MLQEARRYIEMGYSVIPLRPGGKEPLIPWKEFTERHATEKELSEWFGSGENNLGIVTGAVSGCVVVDVDGEDGFASASTLGLQSTTVQLTGKGRQYFYRPPSSQSLKNAVRILPGIDIRSDGGFVCAPPSIHPNGKRYTWLLGLSGASNLPSFPESVLSVLARESSVQPSSQNNATGWVTEALASLKEGNRNDTFARVVGKLHHSGLDKTTIWTLLLPHARNADFSEKELNNIIQSITRYATDAARVDADPQSASIESFLNDYTPVLWICSPILARGALGFVAGLPETYKTWLLIDLAIECARGGGLWLGLFPAEGARVLFIDQERSKGETQRRFKGVIKSKGIDPRSLKGQLYIKSGTTIRLDLDQSFNAFKREVSEIRPDLILVDSFATFHVSDENDRMTIQKVMERVKELRTEFGCSVVFIDHENKGAYQAQQMKEAPTAGRLAGSVGKVAAAEFVLTVRRYDPTTCAVYHTKSTLGPRVPSFVAHVVDTVDGGIRVYGQGGK